MVALKGQAHLLQAVAALTEQERAQLEVHFFGDGPEMQALQQLASSLELSAQTHFHGMQLDREVIYGEADLMVICSEQEGLSIALMESMARGIPAVATDVGDSATLVLHEETGLLFDYGDVDKLVKHLGHLLRNRETLQALGTASRRHIESQFSIDTTTLSYTGAYFD